MPTTKEDTGKQTRPAVGAHTVGQGRANTNNPLAGGWSKPRKPSQAQTPPQPTPVTVKNRFGMLSEEGEELGDGPGPEPEPPPPRKTRTRRKGKKNPPAGEQDEQEDVGETEVKLLERPHRPTWFLPGRVGKVPVQILIDTGCTTNLMSKTVFDRLDKATREAVEPCEAFGTLADGGKLRLHGMVKTRLKIRHYQAEETFVIGRSDEDIILGMSFFVENDCSLDFRRGTLKLQGKELACTDREGRPLVYRVQVYKDVELPPGEEITVAGRVPKEAANLQGIVEGQQEEVIIAASLNQPDEKGRLLLRCLNLADQPVRLTAGTVVGEWHRVDEKDIQGVEAWLQEHKKKETMPDEILEEEPRCCLRGRHDGNSQYMGTECEILGTEPG